MPYETAYDEPLTTSLGDALMGTRAKKRPMPNRAKLGLAALYPGSMGTPAMPQTMTGDYAPLPPQNAWEGNQLYGTGQPASLAEALGGGPARRAGGITGLQPAQDWMAAPTSQGMLPIHPGSGGISAQHIGGTPRDIAMNPRVSPAASDLRRILSGQQGDWRQANAQSEVGAAATWEREHGESLRSDDYGRPLAPTGDTAYTRGMLSQATADPLYRRREVTGPDLGRNLGLLPLSYERARLAREEELADQMAGKTLGAAGRMIDERNLPAAMRSYLAQTRGALGLARMGDVEGTAQAMPPPWVGDVYGKRPTGPAGETNYTGPPRSTWEMAQGTQVNPKLIDPRLAALLGGQPSTGQQGPTGQPLTLADVIRGRDAKRKDTNDMRQLMVTARAQGHPISLQQAMFAHAVNTGKPPQDPGSYAIAGLNPQDSPQLAEQKARYGLFGALMQHPGQMTAQQLADALKGGLGGGGGAVPPVLVPTMVPGQGILGGSGPGQPLNEANLDPLPQTDPAGPQRFVDRTTKLIWRKIVQDGKVTYELESPRVRPGNINIPPLNIGLK